MSYKNLLVHLDNSRACDKRVDAALDLAARFDAHLTGIYVGLDIVIPSYVLAQMPPEARELQARTLAEQADAAVSAFEAAAKRAGRSVETRRSHAIEDAIPEVLGLHGRYADLVITGQHDPDDDASMSESGIDHMVLTVGRPTLIVPYIGAPSGFGSNIMLAWDGSRESARAASDALPFLRAAERVSVIAVNPERGIRGHGEEPGADIALTLARHGVKAEAQHVIAEGISVADSLLSRAADEGADMIVMGGYGHSRLRELVLGGVTRDILERMTVPALMSH